MADHEKKEAGTLTIVEAVETLSNIADLAYEGNIGIAQQHDVVVQDNPLSYRTVHWLHRDDSDITIDMVKDIFKVILSYLRNFYKDDYSQIKDAHTVEGIKTIMVLVGEAAKKLDKYTHLFQDARTKSVTELKEYKKLQEFYLSRIDRKIDEGTLGKWIMALSQKTGIDKAKKPSLIGRKGNQSKHIFVDLESVKKDTEYELFFLRKEDGSRFFSPRLIRNIKLISDFGDFFGEEKREDPLLNAGLWQDRVANLCAKNMIRATHRYIERFYREAINAKDRELVEKLNKSLMALMLAANPHNLSHNLPLKNCRDYFHDFQLFLRACLHTSDYQHLIAYPPPKANKLAWCLLNTMHVICMALYTQLSSVHDLFSMIHGLIQKAHQEQNSGEGSKETNFLSAQLEGDYKSLNKMLKLHPNGPLNKILNSLETGNYSAFDPLIQENLPSQLFTLYAQESKYLFARWPSPTHQEFIHKAVVTDEFKGFLRGCLHEHTLQKCLIFNLQDRSTWKDHVRCTAIEELANNETFDRHVEVVTLAKDSEFYHQLAPYNQENHANVFMQVFKEQLADENCGFLFPESIKKPLMNHFVDEAMHAVHRIFFSGKNVLSREQRMNFIEIFYLFLELKIVDLLKPDVIGFCCKDGIDVGVATSAELFVFLKFLNQERLSEMDREHLDLMLYGNSLLFRERTMLPERFNRMVSTLATIESAREHFGQANFVKIINEAFGRFYKTPILHGKVIVQNHIDEL